MSDCEAREHPPSSPHTSRRGVDAPSLICIAVLALTACGANDMAAAPQQGDGSPSEGPVDGAQNGTGADVDAGGGTGHTDASNGMGADGDGGMDAPARGDLDSASEGSLTNGDSGDGGARGTGAPVIQQFDTACLSVPDPDIAASDALVGMVGQWTAYFYKKADGSPDHRYTWPYLPGWSAVSDTHIVFDRISQRWFITTIASGANGTFGVQVMVSSDATASSWQLSIPATDSQLIDNPQPTVTTDKVLLVYHGPKAWVIDKADLAGGNAQVVAPTATDLPSADNWVAVKYGQDSPETAYAVTLIDQTTLGWISIDGTHAANDIRLNLNRIPIPSIDTYPFSQDLYAAKSGGNTYEAGQVKAMAQKGHIYWAKTVGCGGLLCERLFDVDTTSNTVKTTDFDLNGNSLWWGVPGVDKYDNIWMLATASTLQGPMGLALMGEYASGTIYPARQILAGIDRVGSGQVRMGDYASAAQDPTDGSVWLIGSYGAKNPNPLNPENNLGCRAVHVTAE